VERHQLRIRCGRNLAPTLLFGNPIHVLFENMVRTKSRGAILLGNFSAHHENTVRTNSRRVQKTQKRRKGLRLSRPFRPLPLIRGSGFPNVTCKVQAPVRDAPFYTLHFTFHTHPARRWILCAAFRRTIASRKAVSTDVKDQIVPPCSGETARIIPHRKIKFKHESAWSLPIF